VNFVGFKVRPTSKEVKVTPLGITAHFTKKHLHRIPYPKVRNFADKFLIALALPGEMVIQYGNPFDMFEAAPIKNSKKKVPAGIEAKAKAWVEKMAKEKSLAKFLDENTFAEVGAIVTFFSMIMSFFVPIEGFQNTLLGMVIFWVGANGVHGDNVRFEPQFWAIILICGLSMYFLVEPKSEEELKKKESKKAAKKADDTADWDDGIGGVSMDQVRKRGGHKGDCCG